MSPFALDCSSSRMASTNDSGNDKAARRQDQPEFASLWCHHNIKPCMHHAKVAEPTVQHCHVSHNLINSVIWKTCFKKLLPSARERSARWSSKHGKVFPLRPAALNAHAQGDDRTTHMPTWTWHSISAALSIAFRLAVVDRRAKEPREQATHPNSRSLMSDSHA
eukprot:213604-Chlamydomonas_euryale.AAC.31